MKHVLATLALLAAGVVAASAQSYEEQYVRIYNLIQTADALSFTGKSDLALPKYLEAQTALQRINKLNPEWNQKVVSYRLRYIEEKIADISGGKPAAAPVVVPTPKVESSPARNVVAPAVPVQTETKPAPPSPEMVQQMASLQEELRKLQAEKKILESKLKEALATQPAAIDPRELTKAQERIQSLTKENDLLKTSLDEEKKNPARTSAKELEEIKRALAAANTKIEEQTAIAAKFETERTGLKDQITKLTAASETAEVLRAENELLKKQLAESKAAAPSAEKIAESARRLGEAEARVASLTSDADVLRLEKLALEARLKRAATAPATVAKSQTVTRPADLERIRQLEKERDEYIARIETMTKQSIMGRGGNVSARVEQLTREVTALRARLDVFEAKAIPYTKEELALFAPPVVKPAALPDEKTSTVATTSTSTPARSNLPESTISLAARAQKHFEAKQFDKAEENYLEILKQDDKNAYTRANLAAIQLEMGRLDEAEKQLKAALEISPEDGYATMLMGLLKFRQEKWDDAIEALSRAAKIAPNNAEVHDNLGVALSQKGLRGPAEQSFRRALVLNPDNANVQSHLALFYALDNPPRVALARFHYKKAVAAEQPRNPDIEKLFETRAASAK
jgi:tetratricopeptide (TPR) repeat protein